jgi:hypothetical protein
MGVVLVVVLRGQLILANLVGHHSLRGFRFRLLENGFEMAWNCVGLRKTDQLMCQTGLWNILKNLEKVVVSMRIEFLVKSMVVATLERKNVGRGLNTEKIKNGASVANAI